MTPDRWERVKQLFDEALGRDAEAREGLLANQCPDDVEVRNEVLRLLSQRDQMETDFLDPPGQRTLLDRAAWSLADQIAPRYAGALLAGRYFVEREIGRGGSGVVYLAQDRQLHSRHVVLKFTHAGWEDHRRVQLKFQQEIEALSRIHHDGVVGVLDVGQAPDGRSFLVMEYVHGVTLRSLLQDGVIEFSKACEILESICDALEAAHRNGILHRDLKPENIMLPHAGTDKPAAKLIDFGIAKVQDSGFDAKTQTLTIVGTVLYAAPEQLMGKSERRSDIYALGVVFYEMLTGRVPFNPQTPFQLYELQRAGKVVPPSRLRTGIPKRVDRAILRALSFRPEDRPGSAREFVEELRHANWWRARSKVAVRVATWAMAALFLVTGAAAGIQWAQRHWEPAERAVEFSGGRDPEDFGFLKHDDIQDRVLYDSQHVGFDAVSLLSKYQGYYYRKLSKPQAFAALRHGWSLSGTVRPVKGAGSMDVDLSPAAGRFDVHFFLNPLGRQVVQLSTQIEKGVSGLDYEIDGQPDAFHDYKLIFDPATREARLLVDGVERLRGYRGHHEYLSDFGLMFGVALYKSDQSEVVFKRIRFEINP